MSIRAYRVEKIVYQEGESFGFWNDEKLITFFDKECPLWRDSLSDDSTGITCISIEAIKKAIKHSKKLDIDAYQKRVLLADIKSAKKDGTDWVRYYCF